MKCPTCGKEVEFRGNPFRPFCSERCKLIDLGKWAGEEYRIPTAEKPSMEGEGAGRDSFEDSDVPPPGGRGKRHQNVPSRHGRNLPDGDSQDNG